MLKKWIKLSWSAFNSILNMNWEKCACTTIEDEVHKKIEEKKYLDRIPSNVKFYRREIF